MSTVKPKPKSAATSGTGLSTAPSVFVQTVLSSLNKSCGQQQIEAIEKFRKNSIIQCKTQITLIQTSKIPLHNLVQEDVERELEEAQTAKQVAFYTPQNSFEQYIQEINSLSDKIAELEDKLVIIQEEIEDEQERIKSFQEIQAILES
jgi:chromosome segregation ATPase